MTSLPKRVLYGSIGLMAIVGTVTVLDVATGWIFGRLLFMDACFLIAGGIIVYLALDALKEQK